MVLDYSDDLLPLPIPTKSGTIHAVRIVLANSKEDKDLLEVMRNFYSFLLAPSNFFSLEIIVGLHCTERASKS